MTPLQTSEVKAHQDKIVQSPDATQVCDGHDTALACQTAPTASASQHEIAPYDEKTGSTSGSDACATEETYRMLRGAYAYYNAALFQNELPDCLITLQRHRGAYGYFFGASFEDSQTGQEIIDEIAINPSLIKKRSLEETCSTLVHEMCHVWQFHYSAYSPRRSVRRSYHDREWAEKMEQVGLIPSSTGLPGGKKTGRGISHYIVPDGPFAVATKTLLGHGFFLPWIERSLDGPEEQEGQSGEPLTPSKKKRDLSKQKFTCPSCGQNAWAKQSARLACAAPGCNGVVMRPAYFD